MVGNWASSNLRIKQDQCTKENKNKNQQNYKINIKSLVKLSTLSLNSSKFRLKFFPFSVVVRNMYNKIKPLTNFLFLLQNHLPN